MKHLIAALLLAGLALAQQPGPSTPNVSAPSKLALLEAQHEVDVVTGRLKDIQLQYATLQAQMKALQDAYPVQTKALEDANGKLKAAQEAAVKAAGLKPEEWVVDLAGMTFVAKPKPAPEAGAKGEKQ